MKDNFDLTKFLTENKLTALGRLTEANKRTEAQYLKKGDIITSGEEIVSVSAGARTPAGKVEVTLKNSKGKERTAHYGKTTLIGVKAKEDIKEGDWY